MHIDASQVNRLAVDLRGAPDRIQRQAPKVFEVGINKAKRTLKRMASGHRFLPQLDNHVEYERFGLLNYELGFAKRGQGSLANIAVYGSINNAPVMGTPADALLLELPSILEHLGAAGEDSVLGSDA